MENIRTTTLLQKQPLKIYQDDFTPSKGNALQACVASIFGQPLNQVPNFITLECGYYKGIVDYVKQLQQEDQRQQQDGEGKGEGGVCYTVQKKAFQQRKEGDAIVNVVDVVDAANSKDDVGEEKICIIRGKSPRGDFGHVVVGRIRDEGIRTCTVQMVHDPHPDETFLDMSEQFGWYMIFE